MKKECIMREDGSILTCEFRVSFPKLFEAGDDGKYGVAMLFPKDSSDLSLIQEAIVQILKEEQPKGAPPGYMLPIHDGDKKEVPREEQLGHWVINGKAGKYRPEVVDQDRNPITDSAEVYPGCWARAIVRVSSWNYPAKKKKGISVYFDKMQKLRDGEVLISRTHAADEFDAVCDVSTEDL